MVFASIFGDKIGTLEYEQIISMRRCTEDFLLPFIRRVYYILTRAIVCQGCHKVIDNRQKVTQILAIKLKNLASLVFV